MPLTVRDAEQHGAGPVFVCDICGVDISDARKALMGWITGSEEAVVEGPLFYCVGDCARQQEARTKARGGFLGDTHLSYALVNMLVATNVNLPEATAGALAMAGYVSEEDDVDTVLKAFGVRVIKKE